MPELPEVETVRRNLASRLSGSCIQSVKVGDYPRTIQGLPAEAFEAATTGCRILTVARRAKFLMIPLDSGQMMTIHLRMTGELSVVPANTPETRHLRVRFTLDDGDQLRFNDIRKFGRIRLLSASELSWFDRQIGPEPLDQTFTPSGFFARLSERKRAIKPLLLDQSFIAGLGNIYADEALFEARIHPLRAANSLSLDEATALLSTIRSTLASAIERGGSTIRDYRNGLGAPGENQDYLHIYTLPAGAPCPRCSTPIVRVVVGQRGTKLCPTCQPLSLGDSTTS